MNDLNRNMFVGMFVLASLIVLATLMFWFGETPTWLSQGEWTLRITGVRDLSGLSEGSPVRLSGVEIGRVQVLVFENPDRPHQGVAILARIKNQFFIPHGSIAHIYGATLGIGTGHVSISVPPGGIGEPLDQKMAEIPGEVKSLIKEMISPGLVDSFERTMTNIGNLADAATPVAQNLAALLERRTVAEVTAPDAAEQGITPSLATVVERLDQLVANFNAVVGDTNVQEDVKAAVKDLRMAASDVRELTEMWKTETQKITDNANSGIDRVESRFDASFSKLDSILDHLDDGSKSAANVLQGIAKGQGTLGRLAGDDRLYEAAVLAFQRLADSLASINRITEKWEEDGYIRVAQDTVIGTIPKDIPITPRKSRP